MYNILIKVDGMEKRRRSVGLLHLLAGFFLMVKAADYYRLTQFQKILPIVMFFGVGLVSLLYGFFRKKWDAAAEYNYIIRGLQSAAFVALGVMMWRVGSRVDISSSFIWALSCIVIFFSERIVFKETNLNIDTAGITVPGSYTNQLLSWALLSDITIREDYITIFHKNNKYLQYQVMQALPKNEILQMTDFCKEQLSKPKELTPNLSTK